MSMIRQSIRHGRFGGFEVSGLAVSLCGTIVSINSKDDGVRMVFDASFFKTNSGR